MTSARTSGFTLTELLVVIAILGLIVLATAGLSPKIFERAAFTRARAQLVSDFVNAAVEAHRTGQFGQAIMQSARDGYTLRVGSSNLQRDLPPGIEIRIEPNPLDLDPAGRFAPGAVRLRGGKYEVEYRIDPFVGRLRIASDRADGSHRRGGGAGAVLRAVSGLSDQRGWPASAREGARIADRHCAIAAQPELCPRPFEREYGGGLLAQILHCGNRRSNGAARFVALRIDAPPTVAGPGGA